MIVQCKIDILENEVWRCLSQCLPQVYDNKMDESLMLHYQMPVVLVAVSGGADSVALLYALCNLSHVKKCFRLEVVTVDHRMRSDAESGGDVRFVEDLCMTLGLHCHTVQFARGEVQQEALRRNKGEEEAARFLRYRAFELCANKVSACLVCMAHNQNDQCETVLMRLFQGGGFGSLSGILERRGIFCRPLLHVSRCDIELYLEEVRGSFRTDVTNTSSKYMRSRLRTQLIPALNALFPGWESGVLQAAEKSRFDDEALDDIAAQNKWKKLYEGCVVMDEQHFDSASVAVRFRLLYEALTHTVIEQRVPYALVKKAVMGQKRVRGASVDMRRNGKEISVCRTDAQNEPFSVSITEPRGVYTMSWGTIEVIDTILYDKVTATQNSAVDSSYEIQGPFCLPLVVRNYREDDRIQTADGSEKVIKKIFCDWKVPVVKRSCIPIIEETHSIRCIWGKPSGYSNWYVQRNTVCQDDRKYSELVVYLQMCYKD